MFVTPLNFEQVLDRFYNQSKYELMLLFVSSFDGNDRIILKELVDNANRIDRITGERICFFYFVRETDGGMDEKLVRWVRDISDRGSLYGEGICVTMETADDICQHFGVLRSNLPAFILVGKDKLKEPQVLTVRDYQDFESFLTPLNILHSYIEDRNNVINKQKVEAPTVVETDGIDENIVRFHIELSHVRNRAVERLNISLNSHDGERIIDLLDGCKYSEAVHNTCQLLLTKGVRLSRILERIRLEIQERNFNVFISCKSQDYGLAHNIFDFLKTNGFNPFLADSSIKEVGIDQYTALIGEVINACQYMVVFATDVSYLETPYVSAEWHTFINDINTGHKPNAKIVSILSPDINTHRLPLWLRDKQCLTTENYKHDLIHFLCNRDNDTVERLLNEVKESYFRIRDNVEQLLRCQANAEINHRFCRFREYVEMDYHRIVSRLDSFRTYDKASCDINEFELGKLSAMVKYAYEKWKSELQSLVREVEQIIENEEAEWHKTIHYDSIVSFERYLERFQHGIHYNEALERLRYLREQKRNMNSSLISFSPSTKLYSERTRPSERGTFGKGTVIGSAMPIISGGPIGTFVGCIKRWFCERKKNKEKYDEVYSSIFAPSEVKLKSHLLVQVYLHLFEETEKVMSFAKESDNNAKRRDYIPLQCKLKKDDKVDVLLNIYGETLLMSDKKSVVWQGSFTKCSFDYFVSKDIDVDELSCVAMLIVNGIPVGEMKFLTRVVDVPRQLNPEIIARKYNKVFISYSHQDEAKVRFLHEGLELGAVPHFFDRKYLKVGDVFPQVIKDYIDSADLFILCWSENASKSEYVQKERLQALERAFPQVKPEQKAKLRIYPMSIDPRAELPFDMKNNYHFGEI